MSKKSAAGELSHMHFDTFHQLEGNPDRKRPLGRLWVDNIRMDLVAIGWGGLDWTGLPQDRDTLVNAVTNLQVP
jgi:hypothetical protein